MTGCRKPCAECPFSRKTEPGALGGSDPAVFIGQAHGAFLLSCHMDPDYEEDRRSPKLLQCAGAAVFRANITSPVLLTLPKFLLKLPADHEAVFSTPAEFLAHHAKLPLETAEEFLRTVTPLLLLNRELRRAGVQVVSTEVEQ